MITCKSLKINNLNEKFYKKILDILTNTYNLDINDPYEVPSKEATSAVSSLFEDFFHVSNFKSIRAKCPNCGKYHLEPFNSSYSRKVYLLVGSIVIRFNITVERAKCSNCNKTHSLLPEILIPFKRYSKISILDIAKLTENNTVEEVSHNLNMDSRQVFRFRQFVLDFMDSVVLISKEYNWENLNYFSLAKFINTIPSDITKIFFDEFSKIFLMTAPLKTHCVGFYQFNWYFFLLKVIFF